MAPDSSRSGAAGPNVRRIADVVKVLLGGLFVALAGAPAGSLLLSLVVEGGHFVLRHVLQPGNPCDLQWEMWVLMGTVPYGALWGCLAAPATVAWAYKRRRQTAVAALVSLPGSMIAIAVTLAAAVFPYIVPTDFTDLPDDAQVVRDYVAWFSPLLAGVCLFSWAVSRLPHRNRARRRQR